MTSAERIAAFLERSEIPHRQLDARTFALALAGDQRLQIAVTLAIGDEDVTLQSFFMRAPHENRDAFYELLLKRNAGARSIAFAIDADGDVFLVGRMPSSAIDDARLDAWIGAVLIESDGMFRAAMEIGFASYLEADMAWRATQASPPA